MNLTNLATVLTITFVVSVVVVLAELLFVLLHRSYYPTSKYSSKNLLNFFCLKYKTRVEPSESPNKKPDVGPVIDMFKLLESNGPSRVLCTIKEDDREEIESVKVTERVSLQVCLELEAEAERAATALVSPCESPVFFTPLGSPALDGVCSEFVTPVSGNGSHAT